MLHKSFPQYSVTPLVALDAYVSCDDEISARGMRILASPLGEDKRVVAGESGSVGLGLLSVVMERED